MDERSTDAVATSGERPAPSATLRDLLRPERRRARFWLLFGIVCVVLGALVGFLVFRASPNAAERGQPESRPSDASGS